MTEQEMLELEERQRGRKRKTSGSYASKYYDPDKAHEYYIKHRKLKGTKKKKAASKSSKSKYSEGEKQLLQWIKDEADKNIAALKDMVEAWVNKQEEVIDNTEDSEEKKRIRKRIRAVKREMNAKIRVTRQIVRNFKEAYKNHNIEKYTAEQTAIAQQLQGGDNNAS